MEINKIELKFKKATDIESVKKSNTKIANKIIFNENEKLRMSSSLKIFISKDVIYNVYKDCLELSIISFDGSSYNYLYFDKRNNTCNISYNGKTSISNIFDFLDILLNEKSMYGDLTYLFYNLGIIDILNNNYCESDDDISLYINRNDISDEKRIFLIIDNTTLKQVGTISIDPSLNGTHYGNVSYTIQEEYRNNGYATKALGLLKTYLEQLENFQTRYLHMSLLEDNIASQRVVQKNDAELIYEGILDEPDFYDPENVRIRMYEIKLSQNLPKTK